MSASAVETSEDGIAEQAVQLRGQLRAEARAGDDQRGITDAAFGALRDAGMLRLGVPKRWGGHGASATTTMRSLIELGRGDLSSSWIAFVLNVGAWSTAMCTDKAQEEVWGDGPDVGISGVYSPSPTGSSRRVDGGFVISGRWGFNSGIMRAGWTQVAFLILADDGSFEDVGFALIPVSDLTIEDTWHIAGVRGSASNTAVATDLFVPEYRVIYYKHLFGGYGRSEDPQGILGMHPLVTAEVLMLAGPLVGAGLAAVELARPSVVRDRPLPQTDYQRALDAPSYQLAYARAASKADTAVLHALRAAGDVDAAAAQGVEVDELTRARIRMDITAVVESAREAINLSLTVAGASTFADGNPLNQVWRDFEVASRHAAGNTLVGQEHYGRALLGLPSQGAF